MIDKIDLILALWLILLLIILKDKSIDINLARILNVFHSGRGIEQNNISAAKLISNNFKKRERERD